MLIWSRIYLHILFVDHGYDQRIDENILNTPEMTEVIPVFVTFSKNVSAEVSFGYQSCKGLQLCIQQIFANHVSLSFYIQLSKNRNDRNRFDGCKIIVSYQTTIELCTMCLSLRVTRERSILPPAARRPR